MLSGLRHERLLAGLTQEELSERSGVGRDTIQKLETGQRPARPATIKKLANALGIGTEELVNERKEAAVEETKTEKKVEVEVRWENNDGRIMREILRFRGEEVALYEEGLYSHTLYECPGGYRVHVENGNDGTASLHPSHLNNYTGELEYPTYSAEELVQEFPFFGEEVGVYRVRDID